MSAAQIAFFFEGKSCLYNWRQNLLHGWRLPNQRDITATLCYGNIAPAHAFLTRREAIIRNGLRFDEALKACEDYDFWLKLAISCGEPGTVNDGMVYYRKHPTSMSSNQQNQFCHDSILIERAYAALENDQMPGSTQRLEYMTANFAATLKTYYRLRSIGQDQHASTLLDHIERLIGQFTNHRDGGATRTTRYRSEMRVYWLKLSRDEAALPESTGELVSEVALDRRITFWRYFRENLKARNTSPELINIVFLDIQYIYLKLKYRLNPFPA